MKNVVFYHDHEYLNLVADILDNGTLKSNRTGINTISVFSRQLRFDLEDGSIPLLTTKKMHIRSIIYEILWYLLGSGNTKYLNDNSVSIWDEWASHEGHLNKVYGAQWRRWEDNEWRSTITEIKLKPYAGINKPFINENTKTSYLYKHHVDDPYELTIFGEGCIGEYSEKPKYYSAAYELWYDMMKTCYGPGSDIKLHNIDNAFVDQPWRCFANFLRDIHDIPWFNNWKEQPSEYKLNKEYYGAKCYSKDTCIFLPSEYHYMLSFSDGSKYIATHTIEENKKYEFTIPEWFANTTNMQFINAMRNTLTTNLDRNNQVVFSPLIFSGESAHNWKFEKIYPREGYAFRQRMFIDQISNIIDTLRKNVDDRRIIVSAWNVADIEKMALPPCHMLFQFYVVNGRLSCKLTQRSADVGLGVPFNIVQYSILTHMIAQVTDLKPGEFIWDGGDVHIYVNHIKQLRRQLKKTPFPSPKLKLNPNVTKIDDFKYEDFEIVEYEHHPLIKMEVAI